MTSLRLPLTAILLLVLATPVVASPQRPTPAQRKDIRAWKTGNEACYYRTDPEAVEKGCATADRLRKKLGAQGFCFYGHGVVGRAGGPKKEYPGSNHCYELLKRPR